MKNTSGHFTGLKFEGVKQSVVNRMHCIVSMLIIPTTIMIPQPAALCQLITRCAVFCLNLAHVMRRASNTCRHPPATWPGK